MSDLLQLKEVSKAYGTHIVLDKITLGIPAGSVFGLLGPNGAGKTSLIRIITQITAPDSGEILYDGQPLCPAHLYLMGYLPEERGLYKKMAVGEQLLYLARLKGMTYAGATKKIKYWLSKFEIEDWFYRPIEDLSKGMQQKIQFIATVIHDPAFVILDEPFTGFDPVNAKLLKDEILQLKANGTTIIFSTHRMESVEELCDDIALINEAHIVLQGNKNQVRNSARLQIYEIVHEGIFHVQHPDYELISQQNFVDGTCISLIKLRSGTANGLIRYVADAVPVISFKEKIPDMNEIFIRAICPRPVLL